MGNLNKFVSRGAFAKIVGVSPAAITKACGSVLKDACYGKRIDMKHEVAISYAESKKTPVALENKKNKVIPKKPHIRGTAARKETKKKQALDKIQDDAALLFSIPENIQAFADMSLRDLIRRFGTDTGFVDWLTAIQKIEAINEKRLKNAQAEGSLINRDLIKKEIIDPVETAHIQLLTDCVTKISRRVPSLHDAGAEISEIEKFISDQIQSFIKPLKNKMKRAFNAS